MITQADAAGVAGVQPPRLRADLHDPDVRRVVDVERGLGQLVRDLEHVGPAVADPALAHVVALDRRLRRQHAVEQLTFRHLEREQGDRALVLQRDVLGQVGDEGALAHRRAGGEHDHRPGLQAAGRLVEVAVAGRQAGDLAAVLLELLEVPDLLVDERADRVQALRLLLGRDLEDQALGALDDQAGVVLPLEHGRLDLVGRVQQAAELAEVRDDLGVPRQRRDLGDRRGQLPDRLAPAGLIERPGAPQLLDDRDRVDRLVLAVELADRLVDDLVLRGVEVVGLERILDGQAVPGLLREHHRAEHGLLGVEVVRRDVGWSDRAVVVASESVEVARSRERGRVVGEGWEVAVGIHEDERACLNVPASVPGALSAPRTLRVLLVAAVGRSPHPTDRPLGRRPGTGVSNVHPGPFDRHLDDREPPR